jgi:hypothetical protein
MKIKVWLIIFFMLVIGNSPYADAMTKAEAKKLVKGDLQYYSPSRKATKIRKKTESVSLMQCLIGLGVDAKTYIITPSRLELIGHFKKNDKLVSVNGVLIDWELDHPRGFWGSLDKLPIEKGDEISLVVQREGNKVQVKIPCLGERQEMTELAEDTAVALNKYKGKKFLDKWGHRRLDCLMIKSIVTVAGISITKGEIKQASYNSFSYARNSCLIKWEEAALKSGYRENIDPLFLDQARQNVDFLFKYDSPSLARQLERELDDLVQIVREAEEHSSVEKNDTLKTEIIESPASSNQISAEPRVDITTMLSTCTAKKTNEERLMCFELATELAEGSVITKPEDQESIYEIRYGKDYFMAPNGRDETVRVSFRAMDEDKHRVPEDMLGSIALKAIVTCKYYASNPLSFVPKELFLYKSDTSAFPALSLTWYGKNAYGAESKEDCYLKVLSDFSIELIR